MSIPVMVQLISDDGALNGQKCLILFHSWTKLESVDSLVRVRGFFNTNRMVKQYTRNAYYPLALVEHAHEEEADFAAVQLGKG